MNALTSIKYFLSFHYPLKWLKKKMILSNVKMPQLQYVQCEFHQVNEIEKKTNKKKKMRKKWKNHFICSLKVNHRTTWSEHLQVPFSTLASSSFHYVCVCVRTISVMMKIVKNLWFEVDINRPTNGIINEWVFIETCL